MSNFIFQLFMKSFSFILQFYSRLIAHPATTNTFLIVTCSYRRTFSRLCPVISRAPKYL